MEQKMKVETMFKKILQVEKSLIKKFEFLDEEKFEPFIKQEGSGSGANLRIFVLDIESSLCFPVGSESEFNKFKKKYETGIFEIDDWYE